MTAGKEREKSRTRIECHEREARVFVKRARGHVLDFHPVRL